MKSSEVIIIGGGIVGLATAYDLSHRYPDKPVMVLEKEHELAAHQTGRNSGVLHSGIYYKPGSLKAFACREGKRALEAFCEREDVRFRLCGKVIVACEESELDRLNFLYERGRANGVGCEIISRSRLDEIEPHARGLKAIHIPGAGIVDYGEACERMAARIRERGGSVITDARVTGIVEKTDEVILESTAGDFSARYLINCAGLQADRVTAMSGARSPVLIVPFRGEYFKLKPKAAGLCRGLIYPVPDPRFPFLGVHVTPMTDGSVECGPGAILAFAREGYQKTDINLADLVETLTYPGFLRLAARYWRKGAAEMWQSLNKAAFVRAVQRLVPEIEAEDMIPSPSGVRAQALAPDGTMVDDFAFQEQPRIVNVINAPSPAATSSLALGKMIVERLATRFDDAMP